MKFLFGLLLIASLNSYGQLPSISEVRFNSWADIQLSLRLQDTLYEISSEPEELILSLNITNLTLEQLLIVPPLEMVTEFSKWSFFNLWRNNQAQLSLIIERYDTAYNSWDVLDNSRVFNDIQYVVPPNNKTPKIVDLKHLESYLEEIRLLEFVRLNKGRYKVQVVLAVKRKDRAVSIFSSDSVIFSLY